MLGQLALSLHVSNVSALVLNLANPLRILYRNKEFTFYLPTKFGRIFPKQQVTSMALSKGFPSAEEISAHISVAWNFHLASLVPKRSVPTLAWRNFHLASVRDSDSDWRRYSREGGDGFRAANY